MDYRKFVEWLGREHGMGVDWASRAREAISFFGFHRWGLASTFLANRSELDVSHHMANQLGHILLNTYRCEGRGLPPFFDDAYAALMEYTLLKRNLVFTLGSGRYERRMNNDELRFFEDGNWIEPLRDAMRARADTPLDQVVRRDFGEMTQMDIGKGMALFSRWRAQGDGKVKAFIDALRDAWPSGNPRLSDMRVHGAIQDAFRAIENKDIPPVDEELRRFVMTWKEARGKDEEKDKDRR